MKRFKFPKVGLDRRQPSVTQLVFRWIGCLIGAFIVMAALCGLLFYGLSWFAQRTRALIFEAQTQAVTSRTHLVLIDQSGSVMNFASTRGLMRATTKQVVEHLREANSATGNAMGVIRIDAFGAIRRSVLPAMPLQDPTLDAKLEAGLPNWESLGATAFDQLLTSVLTDTEPVSDVVLITDGIPDPISRIDLAARRAYAEQLLNIAQQFAQRKIPVVIVLIGESNRSEWTPVWQSFAETTGGEMFEARTAAGLDGLNLALAALGRMPTVQPTVTLTPSPTNTPLPPTATASPTPTETPEPTRTATAVPVVPTIAPTLLPSVPPTAIPTQPAISPAPPTPVPTPVATGTPAGGIVSTITPLSFIGLCAGSLTLLIVIALAVTAGHRREQAAHRAALPIDEGVLEIQGTETYSVQQIDLSPMALGEVWHIGHGADCDIRLALCKGNDSPAAALVMTEAGPLLESRSETLMVEGHGVQRHALQDDDQVHLHCYVLRYQNLLRRREPVFDEAMSFEK